MFAFGEIILIDGVQFQQQLLHLNLFYHIYVLMECMFIKNIYFYYHYYHYYYYYYYYYSVFDFVVILFVRFKPPSYNQPQYEIQDESIRQIINNSPDFDIPAMSTHYDAWEAVYRQERTIREKSQPEIPSLTQKLSEKLTNNLEKKNIVQDEVMTSIEGEQRAELNELTSTDILTESSEITEDNQLSPTNIEEKIEVNSVLLQLNEVNPRLTKEEMQNQLIKQQHVMSFIHSFIHFFYFFSSN